MTHPISTLGAAHTLISIVPTLAGLYSFVRYRRIDTTTRAGQVYLCGLLLSVLTSFGLSSNGGFNAGHALGILALFAVAVGLAVPRMSSLGGARPYLSSFALSFSFFLLLVPGINETLTRLPVTHPLADGPASPVVRGALALWLIVFAFGSVWQCWWIRVQRQRSH